MENTNKSQGRWKLPRIHQFLLTIYPQLQPHSKTIEQIEGQERMEMEKEHQEAFEELKEKIMSQPVLSLPKRKENSE